MNRAHREHLLVAAGRLGMHAEAARKLARFASTHHRLAIASCNGDYPCDNGERPVEWCEECDAGMVKSKMVKGICESCRTEEKIRELCKHFDVPVTFQGDPRGWTVKLEATQ